MQWDHRRIRRTFLDYFVSRPGLEHREVPSSPIIPADDPTLLFTNAGMNQFKSVLLGQEKRSYTRACSVQKCMRVGGKHNDLDAVGKDGRHLTWFEMLGNWSFGDYFKQTTIEMAWDLSVNVYGLDPSRLYASVYKDDDESYQIWADVIGLDPKQIYRFGDIEKGDDENFWSMGPTGPCGPCTELYYDLGPALGTGPDSVVGGEGDRDLEFWNNVFMQYDRAADGTMTPLPMQSVDTGMGMERITMILQGKTNVYETDLFQPIIGQIAALAKADFEHPEQRVHLQVIADHLRSLTFVLTEGGQFSNEGRGYVLRRILRRAVRHGRLLGFDGPFLWRLVPTVAEVFDGIYELPKHTLDNAADALKEEEGRFFATIDRGLARFEEIVAAKAPADKVVTGDEAFLLHDTYGFPVDLTGIIAEEKGLSVDIAGFERAMTGQRERSRAAGRFYEQVSGRWVELHEGGGHGFAGYGLEQLETHVVRWRQEGDRVELVLEQTPFYAESGGEVADHGVVRGENPAFEVAIDDVQNVTGVVHHFGRLVSGSLADLRADSTVTAVVDVARRGRKTIHHSATHLLNAALKRVLGPHVDQKGSVVEPDRLRFDFSHGSAVSEAQLLEVEGWVNERIRENVDVVVTEGVPIDEARAQGVVALFGEKYGDLVRTVRAGDASFELCGGNHVRRTGDIGLFRITGESAVAAGVRRIEAVVGHAAERLTRNEHALLRQAASALRVEPERLPERIGALQEEVRSLKRALEKARRSGGALDADALLAAKVDVGGVPLVAAKVEVDDRDSLAALADRVRDKEPAAVVVLGAELEGKAMVIVAIGPRTRGDGRFHAGRIVGALAEQVDGRGGGRPDFAQAGGKAPERLADAIAAAPSIVAGLAGLGAGAQT